MEKETRKDIMEILSDNIFKNIPLRRRLWFFFELEWYDMNIKEDRYETDEERKQMNQWVEKMVDCMEIIYNKWEKDDKPIKKAKKEES